MPGVILFPGRERGWEAKITPAQMLQIAQTADDLGINHVACCDHVIVPKSRAPFMGERWYEPVATLGFIAGATRRIKLLTHVLVVPYHNPFEIAKAFGTLDRLSDGRVLLGVGVGHLKPEFRILHANYEERGAVTDEYLKVIDALWRSDEPAFEGKYFQFRDVRMDPRPVQQPRPPIWVGGSTRRSFRRAVELGDGWIPEGLNLDQIREIIDFGQSQPYFQARATPLTVIAPISGGINFAPPATGLRRTWAGRAEDIAEDIQTYLDAGVHGLEMGFAGDSIDGYLENMRRFAAEVMPLFAHQAIENG